MADFQVIVGVFFDKLDFILQSLKEQRHTLDPKYMVCFDLTVKRINDILVKNRAVAEQLEIPGIFCSKEDAVKMDIEDLGMILPVYLIGADIGGMFESLETLLFMSSF